MGSESSGKVEMWKGRENGEPSGRFAHRSCGKEVSKQSASREKSCVTLVISVRLKAAPFAKRHMVLASTQQSSHSSPSASVQGRQISQETVFNRFKSDTLWKNCGALFLCFPSVHHYVE